MAPTHLDPIRAKAGAEGLARLAAIDAGRAAAGEAEALAPLARSTLAAACLDHAAGDDSRLVARFRTAARAAAAHFAMARTGGPADLPLDGEPVRFQGTIDESTVHPGTWLNGLWCSLAVRDLESAFLLAATRTEQLRASSSRADEHAYRLVDALRGLLTDDPETERLLVDALEATDPDLPLVAGAEYALEIRTPEIEILLDFVAGDGDAVVASIRKAAERHGEHWSRPGRDAEWEGAVALGPLGLAAHARDAGIDVDVDSPYLPRAVLELGPPPSVVACAYCLTPIEDGTVLCPGCLEDVTRDAPLELAPDAYRALPRRPCGSCGFRAPERAVRCPSCRSPL